MMHARERAIWSRVHPAVVAVLLLGTTGANTWADRGPLEPLPKAKWGREQAAHLLRRAGLGGTSAEIDKLAELGLDKAVDALVDYERSPYDPPPPAIDPLVLSEPDPARLKALSEEEHAEYQKHRQEAERKAHQEIRLWWLERLVNSPRPLEEKMTLFWHGHFTSGAREVRRAEFMLEQNEFLRRNALGSFRDLLLGISKDRAMLVYLDNARNNKAHPNENYARELMELFSLGVGHYTEDDVKAAARAFTGWGFDEEGFRFRPGIHDSGVKTFLGRSGPWDGEDIVHIIVEQPACSRFLARKLLVCFCRPNPDRELVERLAAEIRRDNFELRPVLKTLFKSRAFYAAEARGVLVKSPIELLVETARQLGVPINNLVAAERASAALGQELMQPPNVKGWDGGARWINTATLFQRYNFITGLINGGGPPARPKEATGTATATAEAETEPAGGSAQMMMAPKPAGKSRATPEPQPPYDPAPLLKSRDLHTPEQIVDFYAGEFLAVPLAPEKRAALVEYLRGAGDGDSDLSARPAPGRIRMMIHLLCSTPEYQMY